MREYDVKKVRERNLKELTLLVDAYNNVGRSFAVQKTEIVREIEADEKLTSKEKEEKLEEKFSEIDEVMLKDMKDIRKKIIKTIKRQISYMSVIEEDKDVYEYWKQVFEQPLPANFGELEQKLYHEFLISDYDKVKETEVDHKDGLKYGSRKRTLSDVRNIVESYSALEDNKKTEEEGKDKDKGKGKKAKGFDPNATDPKSLVEKANQTHLNSDIKAAEEAIEKSDLSDNEKKALNDNLTELKKELFKNFETILEEANNRTLSGKLTYEEAVTLAMQFDNLIDIDEEFSKAKFGKEVSRLIRIYNIGAQDRYKLQVAEQEPMKIKLSDRFIELGSSLFKGLLNTKWARNHRQQKYMKALASNDYTKAEKIKEKIKDNDVINGFRLFCSRNKLAKIKPTLYRDGLSNSSNKIKREYTSSKQNIDAITYNKLIKLMEDENVYKDKERVLIVISQALKQLSVSENVQSDASTLKGFLNDALTYNAIDDAQYRTYIGEIDTIVTYILSRPADEEKLYEINFEELNNEAYEYYKKPYLYEDADERVNALPQVKAYGRK